MRRQAQRGFTLIELMLVVALVGVLATLSVNSFDAFTKRAKRVEGVLALSTVWKVQSLYFQSNGRYAGSFDELVEFEMEGGKRLSARAYAVQRYTLQLSQPWGPQSYYVVATAQLDADDWPDLLEMREEAAP